MNYNVLVLKWVDSGLADLYYSFCINELIDKIWTERYANFITIMAVEKFCKGIILFSKASEFNKLTEEKAKEKIDSIARDYGHKFEKIFLEVNSILGKDHIKNLAKNNFIDYTWKDIMNIFTEGYKELRYPMPRRLYERFPVKNSKRYTDPLLSDVIKQFAYNICRDILIYLKDNKLDFSPMKSFFDQEIKANESGIRFCNSFFQNNFTIF